MPKKALITVYVNDVFKSSSYLWKHPHNDENAHAKVGISFLSFMT